MNKKQPDRIGRRSLLSGAAAVAGGAALASTVPAGAANAAPKPPVGAAYATATPAIVDIAPGDPRFPDLVRGTNQRWVAAPEKVRMVTTPTQAETAVRDAVTAGKRLTVRSGGHCYEDFVFNSQVQIVVDMSAMNQVYFDPAKNAFAIEAGASNLQVYETLYKLYGVTIPAGSCHSVGAGGHISGGGYGLLSRQLGLTVDYLQAVEVVVVRSNGTVETVTASRDDTGALKDLWWAHTGGGGGNFGLITRYWMRTPGATGTNPANLLPKPPSEVFVQALSFPWPQVDARDFETLVKNWGRWHAANSAPTSEYAGLFGLLKLNANAGPGSAIGLITQMDATTPNARALLDSYTAAITAGVNITPQAMTVPMGEHAALSQFEAPRKLPWYIATDYLSGGNPTLYGKYKSSYARQALPSFQVAALWQQLSAPRPEGLDALVQIDSYGCKVNTVPSADTAVPQRDSILKLQYQVYWTDPAKEAAGLAWIRNLYKAVYAETGNVPVPNLINDGCYVNYPDKDLGDPLLNTSQSTWGSLYYKDNFARLKTVKQTWDPTNFFRHAQSIPLQ
ncbi:FAD-binding oxidoreductase [Streptomyces sp. NPDC058953]|uniref:FAD-binding oxidoreductase n=1 Tax=unclassified Streptomyces TaxID=2593676 RepID=UPI0036920F36